MRKIIGLLLMITVCLGLSACGAEHPVIVVSGDHASGPEGVSLEILSARKTKEQGTVLEVRWNNKSDYEVIYGEGFGIQRLEGERWMDLPMRPNTAFTAIGYGLKPHSSATKTYTLDWAYDLSQAGTYRFTADCQVYETPEGSKCELWAEFAVESNPVSLSIDARYIRTNGYWEGRNYPMAALITDREALDTYYSENRDVYNLDASEAFSSLLQEYDAPFFKKYNLLLVLLEEGSGSITHKVSRLVSIPIRLTVPKCTAHNGVVSTIAPREQDTEPLIQRAKNVPAVDRHSSDSPASIHPFIPGANR